MESAPFIFGDGTRRGNVVKTAYIKPSSFLGYLLNKAPELLMGGCPDICDGQKSLIEFWTAYQQIHPSHRLFGESHPSRKLSNTCALAVHGDEGRGLKKSNTTILMMETCIGVNSWENYVQNKTSLVCDTCETDADTRSRTHQGTAQPTSADKHVCYQSTNLKEHSFLTKFVLAAIPRKDKEIVDAILLEIVRDFNTLFDSGIFANGQQWFAACTGAKGDLKWVQRVGQLNRCFGSQISINKMMCHECEAGTKDLPFEDSDHHPKWLSTCFSTRPYSVRPVICHLPFESGADDNDDTAAHERIFRRDLFHNTKQGVFRMFVASAVMLLCKLRYFDLPGETNRRDILLDRAYSHFKLFCETTNRTAALRSFSLSFFNSPTWYTFPWVNCKGSDTAHLLAWVHTMVVGFVNAPLKNEHLPVLKQMLEAAAAGRALQRICYSRNLWLSKRCGGCLYKNFHAFVRHYNGCAFLSLHQWQYTGFGMTSKFHLLCHEKVELLSMLENPNVRWVRNPQLFGCEMNEDIVGKLSRLVRRVSSRTASARALELYLIKSKSVYRRFQQKQAKLKVKKNHLKPWFPQHLGHPAGSSHPASGERSSHKCWTSGQPWTIINNLYFGYVFFPYLCHVGSLVYLSHVASNMWNGRFTEQRHFCFGTPFILVVLETTEILHTLRI